MSGDAEAKVKVCLTAIVSRAADRRASALTVKAAAIKFPEPLEILFPRKMLSGGWAISQTGRESKGRLGTR